MRAAVSGTTDAREPHRIGGGRNAETERTGVRFWRDHVAAVESDAGGERAGGGQEEDDESGETGGMFHEVED